MAGLSIDGERCEFKKFEFISTKVKANFLSSCKSKSFDCHFTFPICELYESFARFLEVNGFCKKINTVVNIFIKSI